MCSGGSGIVGSGSLPVACLVTGLVGISLDVDGTSDEATFQIT